MSMGVLTSCQIIKDLLNTIGFNLLEQLDR